ncbi:MAG TPA: hypothetical protein VM900_14405 [Sphingomonas sp.]|jgi:hypothetical protein|nr:hypothetical protein [Sphingomonas sp.]
MTGIDQKALDSLSVAPNQDDAGKDKSIARRLEKNPESSDARLDNALDESMDASDPPATTQPRSGEPAPSSGFDEDAERKLRDGE